MLASLQKENRKEERKKKKGREKEERRRRERKGKSRIFLELIDSQSEILMHNIITAFVISQVKMGEK